MHELGLWSEDHQNRMDRYFLKKVNHTHNNQLKELIKRIGSLSGFLDPNLIRMVLGGEVQALSLPQREAVYLKKSNKDWVLEKDDQMFKLKYINHLEIQEILNLYRL